MENKAAALLNEHAINETRADLKAAMAILRDDLGFVPSSVAEAVQIMPAALAIAFRIKEMRMVAEAQVKQR